MTDEQGNASVWKLDPETMTVSRVPVSVGDLTGDLAEIAAGLESGDEIVVTGVGNLREGLQVSRMVS